MSFFSNLFKTSKIVCPHCMVELVEPPKNKKKKCPSCKNDVYKILPVGKEKEVFVKKDEFEFYELEKQNVLNFETLGLNRKYYLLSKKVTGKIDTKQKLSDFIWSRYQIINEELVKKLDFHGLYLSYKFMGEFLDKEGKTGHNLYKESRKWRYKDLQNIYSNQLKSNSSHGYKMRVYLSPDFDDRLCDSCRNLVENYKPVLTNTFLKNGVLPNPHCTNEIDFCSITLMFDIDNIDF